jgi:hypothetical protein
MQRPSMSRVVSMLTGDSDVSRIASRPSYLTDWQFKEISENNFSTEEFSRPTTQSSGSRGVNAGISQPHSSEVLLDSVIYEGR